MITVGGDGWEGGMCGFDMVSSNRSGSCSWDVLVIAD